MRTTCNERIQRQLSSRTSYIPVICISHRAFASGRNGSNGAITNNRRRNKDEARSPRKHTDSLVTLQIALTAKERQIRRVRKPTLSLLGNAVGLSSHTLLTRSTANCASAKTGTNQWVSPDSKGLLGSRAAISMVRSRASICLAIDQWYMFIHVWTTADQGVLPQAFINPFCACLFVCRSHYRRFSTWMRLAMLLSMLFSHWTLGIFFW